MRYSKFIFKIESFANSFDMNILHCVIENLTCPSREWLFKPLLIWSKGSGLPFSRAIELNFIPTADYSNCVNGYSKRILILPLGSSPLNSRSHLSLEADGISQQESLFTRPLDWSTIPNARVGYLNEGVCLWASGVSIEPDPIEFTTILL